MKKYIYTLALALSLIILPQISFADTTLGVTQITAVKTLATDNNSYTDGWKWIFNITVPSGEDKLQMKFADWTNGSASIPVAGNMHFYSTQSLNATSSASAISINSASTYGDNLILDTSKGQQIQVVVEVKIPIGTTGGAFSTNYGIQTTGTTTPDAPALSLRLSPTSQATSTFINSGNGSMDDYSSVFGIKAKANTVSWITDLSFKINIKEGYSLRTLIDPTQSWLSSSVLSMTSAPEWADDNTVTFHVNGARLSQNWVDFTLNLPILSTTTPFTITSTLNASAIKAEDNSGYDLGVSGLTDITSNEKTYVFTPIPISVISVFNPSNPATSTVAVGDDIGLASFNFMATSTDSRIVNTSSYIKNISFKLNAKDGKNPVTLIKQVSLYNGWSGLISTSSVGEDGVVAFHNINLALNTTDNDQGFLAISTKPNAETFTISTTLDTSSIITGDQFNNTIQNISSTTDITSNETTFITPVTSIKSSLISFDPATSTLSMGDNIKIANFVFPATTTNPIKLNRGYYNYIIKSLSFKLNIKDGRDPSTLLSGVSLIHPPYDDIDTSTSTIGANGLVTFNNLYIDGGLDSYQYVELRVSTKPSAEPFTISATLDASSIQGENQSGGIFDTSSTTDITSNEITFSATSTATSTTPIGNFSVATYNNYDREYNFSSTAGLSFDFFYLYSSDPYPTLESLKIKIGNDSGVNSNLIFSNVFLINGNTTYAVRNVSSDGTVDFSGLGISLANMAYCHIYADVNTSIIDSSLNQFSASTTLLVDSIVVKDANGNTLPTNNLTNLNFNNSTFYRLLLGLSGSRTIDSDHTDYRVDLRNSSNSDIYVNKMSSVGALSFVSGNYSSDTDSTNLAYILHPNYGGGDYYSFSVNSTSTPSSSIVIYYGSNNDNTTLMSKTFNY